MQSRTAEVNAPKAWALVAAFLITIFLSYFLVYKGVVKSAPSLKPYEHAEMISLAHGPALSARKFGYSDAKTVGRFVFLDSGGKPVGLRIRIHKSASLSVTAEPYYSPDSCRESSVDRAHLTFTSSYIQKVTLLKTGEPQELRFQGYAGTDLHVSLKNEVQAGCGLVAVTFFEENQIRHYPIAFMLIWCVFFLLAARIGLPMIVPAVGLVFNVVLVMISGKVGITSAAELFATSFFSLSLCGAMLWVFGIVLSQFFRAVILFIVLLAFFLMPIIFGGHILAFGSAPNVDTFHAILQSHSRQVIEFWTGILGWSYIALSLLATVALLYFIYATSKAQVKRIACVCVGGVLLLIGIRDYSTYVDMHPMVRVPTSAVASYFYELDAFQTLQASRVDGHDEIKASSEERDSNLVVVIGESANKWHMSSFGYARETTPTTDKLIANGEMLRFNSAYANHIYSNPAISRAFTQASNYNGLQWSAVPSLMNVANAAKVHTSWVSNKLKFGPWDSVMSVIGDDASETIHINKKVGTNLISDRYDAALVPLVKTALRKKHRNKAIFVHLQGSHVEYSSRYPDTFSMFNAAQRLDIFGPAIFNSKYELTRVNTYDNSIYYTDSVLNSILQDLMQQEKPSAFLYFSDHSESVYQAGSHNVALFDYEMTDIPMLFWANNAWRKANPKLWENLKLNRNRTFTNDHIFDTVLGLLKVSNKYADKENDLSSSSYRPPAEPTSLHGSKLLKDSRNRNYWFRRNVAWLKGQQPDLILSSYATTIAQAKHALSDGVQRIYLEVFFNDGGKLMVRGGSKYSFKLDEFLNQFSTVQLDGVSLVLEDPLIANQTVREQYPSLDIVPASSLLSKYDLSESLSYQSAGLIEELSTHDFSAKAELILRYESPFAFN